MNVRRLIGTLLTASVGTAAALAIASGPVQAATPAPPTKICQLSVLSMTALSLLNDGESDFAFLRVGGFTAATTVEFFQGDTVQAEELGNPGGVYAAPATLPLGVFVTVDSGAKQVGSTASILCAATPASSRTFTNGDATYRVDYAVSVL